MKSSIWKNTFREIKSTLNRFLAIFAIVALGVGFFAGVKATTPDMKKTADQYYQKNNLMDLCLVSTYGLTQEDTEAIAAEDGVAVAAPSYSMDILVQSENGDVVVKAHAILDNADTPMNTPVLLQGRMPQADDECVIETGKIRHEKWQIGDQITLSDDNTKETKNAFVTNRFTIVGIVQTPYYISFERGTSKLGNGNVSSFIMVPKEAFNLEYYTEVFVRLEDVRVSSFSQEYKDRIEAQKDSLGLLEDQRKAIRYDEVVTDATKELNDAKKELAAKEKEANEQLEETKLILDDAKIAIEDGKMVLEKTQQDLIEGEEKLEKNKANFAVQSDGAHAQIAAGYTEIQEKERILTEGKDQLTLAYEQLELLKAQIAKLKSAGETEQAATLTVQAQTTEKQLGEQSAQIEARLLEVEAGKQMLADQEEELFKGETAANEQFVQAAQTINQGWEQLEQAKNDLLQTQISYDNGMLEYTNQKIDAEEQLQEARFEIEDGEQKIQVLKEPKWYIFDRNMNPGYEGYEQDADRISAISAVFPVFFFLVATLVCLTTMTRMVEEQRTQIGTLKALGYSKRTIAGKFLIYAGLASVLGSAVGLAIGFRVFPTVIWNAYQTMYTMPDIELEFNITYALISSLGAVLCCMLATFFACSTELHETPAQLIRPKSPKAGKRILLEKIPFFWKRVSFSWKVTLRNLFRYKQRFFMTVIGIGGCTALMLTGFGLRDSIMGIGKKQFDELHSYDMVTAIAEGGSAADDNRLNAKLNAQTVDSLYVMQNVIDVTGDKTLSANLLVPEQPQKLQNFIHLRDRKTQTPILLSEDSVVLTEKLAAKIGASVGDMVTLKKGETQQVRVKVGGITENYIYSYVYLSPSLYESVFDEKPAYKQIFSSLALSENLEQQKEEEQKISVHLLSQENVQAVKFTTGIGQSFEDVLQSMNAVVFVLIICANLLAFIVLYNLTNINVTERLREIATIKVLGFFDKEVSSYVYRENILLTLIGIGVGLIMGIFLHQFVVRTAEIDAVMFERGIHAISYLWSALLTLLFAGLVNIVMFSRLKKISMVESMKSIE